jgi:hypothetical protein
MISESYSHYIEDLKLPKSVEIIVSAILDILVRLILYILSIILDTDTMNENISSWIENNERAQRMATWSQTQEGGRRSKTKKSPKTKK